MCDPESKDETANFEVVKRAPRIVDQTKEELKAMAVDSSIPKGSDATETMDTLWMNRLKKTFLQLVGLFDKRVVVILDGLDACHDQSINQLRDTLESLATNKGQGNIQVWISSRPKGKRTARKNPACSSIDMDQSLMQSSVATFLEAKLLELSHIGRGRHDEALRKAIQCSNSSFLSM